MELNECSEILNTCLDCKVTFPIVSSNDAQEMDLDYLFRSKLFLKNPQQDSTITNKNCVNLFLIC